MKRDVKRAREVLTAVSGKIATVTDDGFTWWTTIEIDDVGEVIGKGRTPRRSLHDALEIYDGRRSAPNGTPTSDHD